MNFKDILPELQASLNQNHPSLSISTIQSDLHWHLPPNSPGLVFKKAELCFSTLPPTPNSARAALQLIPPLDWIQQAEREAKKPGVTSFEDLFVKDVRHPLSTVKYFLEVSFRNISRSKWLAVNTWTDQNAKFKKFQLLIREIKSLFNELHFHGNISVHGSPFDIAGAFATLLSKGMINNEYVDVAITYLAACVERGHYSQVRPGVILTNLLLFNKMDQLSAPIHSTVKELMAHKSSRYLAMPAFHNMHFFVVVVDVRDKHVLIGKFLLILLAPPHLTLNM
jgi:hypothetical protein